MEQKYPRIPLEFAIQEKTLLGKLWAEFSAPQRTLVKAAYGLPLEGEDEQKAWAIFNGACVYDELGFVTDWSPVGYSPQEYDTIVGLIGRRAGKSHLTCFMTLYEILFGGHTDYVNPGQEIIVPYVCLDLPTAKANMKAIYNLAQKNSKLAKEIVQDNKDFIRFKNGITVQAEPPSIKTGRGMAIPIVIMDEVGFWYKTSENANPDYEVQRALSHSRSQFPHGKEFIISTPYTEEGLLYDYARAGTKGQFLTTEDEDRASFASTLVVRASTAAFENPYMVRLDPAHKGRKQFQKIYNRDEPAVFTRESLAQFVASESNFVPGEAVDQVIDKGVKVRRPADIEKDGLNPSYVAVMDPAFRHDDFAFGIFHRNGRGEIVQDFVHTWTPDSKRKVKLDSLVILSQIKQWLNEYRIPVVYSDQYQLESLQQISQHLGFSIVGVDFTGRSKAVLYGSLENLIRNKRIRLLDVPEQRQQLVLLHKKLTPLGNIQIGAPPGKKDDIASILALGAFKALQHWPSVMEQKKNETMFEQLTRQIKKKGKPERWASV